MARKQSLKPLDYELPQTLKAVMESWMPRLQAIAVVTALFAGVEAQLLSIFPGSGDHSSATETAMRFFAFTGLALNLGATLSAILLLIAVASLPTAARQIYMTCDHSYPRKFFNEDEVHVVELNNMMLQGHGETYALRAFGIARGWNFMRHHCILCFMGGCVCICLHTGIGIWLSQSKLVAAIAMPGLVLGFVPPFVAYLFYMESSRCDDCVEERKGRYIDA